MAAALGPKASDLTKRIEALPFAYDFFRAVRLLESCTPELPRVGQSFSPAQDALRFGQNPSLAFAPSTLESFQAGDEAHPSHLFQNFFGLFGPNGPLPLQMTEYARDRQRNSHDGTIPHFFNVFHHRLISLFYRSWAINQKAADLDRPEQARFPVYIASLFGIGMESLRDRDAVEDWAKIYYSGRLSCQKRNAEGLGAILGDYFGIPTLIETFVGQWITLPPESLCRVGLSRETGVLGATAIAGSRFFDCQLKFRVRFGPMKLVDLERMLPISESFRRLKAWVLNYINEELFWDVQLVLKAAEVPVIQLGQGGLLGWTTWLKSIPFKRDAEDLILDPTLYV